MISVDGKGTVFSSEAETTTRIVRTKILKNKILKNV